MSSISEISSLSLKWQEFQEPKERIRLQIFSEPRPPELIVNNLASIEGPVDIYCWYEGSQSLPKSGADFMKKLIFKPLYELKRDAKLCLYSLRAWDFKKDITSMPSSTPLGEAINRINTTAIECIYSSSFFKYCTQVSERPALYKFISKELPNKDSLFSLSANQRKNGAIIATLFNSQASLFNCIKDLDLSSAYSLMQYIEGYYLIQRSVEEGLLKGQKKIEIAFVLPNDEGKYYLDFPKDIEKMLQLDFGEKLNGVDINISFQFFRYGESLTARPYIDKQPKAPRVTAEEIGSYFDYLSYQSFSQKNLRLPFLRDVIHNLNGWN